MKPQFPTHALIAALFLGAGAASAQQAPAKPKPNAIATGIIELKKSEEAPNKAVAPNGSAVKPHATGNVQLTPAPPAPQPTRKTKKVVKRTAGEIVVKRAKIQPKIVDAGNEAAAKKIAAEPARSETKTYVIVVEQKAGENLTDRLSKFLERDIQVISESTR